MTKNSDEMAFEEWVASEDTCEKDGREGYFANNNNFTRDYWIAEKAWQAAIALERKRSAKLVKALKDIEHTKFIFMTKRGVPKFISEHAEKALQEYQVREE
jgi:hypothetical protein